MYKLTLEHIDNGAITHIVDTNYNGNSETYESKKFHKLDEDNVEDTVNLLNFIIKSLGLYTGNINSNKVINISIDYGENYAMTKDEIKREKINYLNKINELTNRSK